MATDPRVEVVARALLDVSEAWPRTGDALDDAYLARKYARAATAALDEYDAPKFSSVVHECCERPTEADLRERIAREIDQAWAEANDAGESHDYLGGLSRAARIARGES